MTHAQILGLSIGYQQSAIYSTTTSEWNATQRDSAVNLLAEDPTLGLQEITGGQGSPGCQSIS
jgi:hypothetical protein